MYIDHTGITINFFFPHIFHSSWQAGYPRSVTSATLPFLHSLFILSFTLFLSHLILSLFPVFIFCRIEFIQMVKKFNITYQKKLSGEVAKIQELFKRKSANSNRKSVNPMGASRHFKGIVQQKLRWVEIGIKR